MFTYQHRVQFYETDLMGIVHHGNYLRLFEEARVAWAVEKKLLSYDKESASHFAVLETHVRHVKPAVFGDLLEIELQTKIEKLRIIFEYKMYAQSRGRELVATATTVHVALDSNLKVMRPLEEVKKVMEGEKWIETWL